MPDRRWRTVRRLAPTIAVGLLFVIAGLVGSRSGETGVTVTFFDVGQGDAVHVRDGDVDVVVDGGPALGFVGQLRGDVPPTDRTLEFVVATHPDADHIAGLRSLIGPFRIERILEPDVAGRSQTAERFRAAIAEAHVPVQHAERGQTFTLPHGALTVLWPPPALDRPASNDHSIVLRLAVGHTCVLFTGDATDWVEGQLLADDLRCGILKVGHHGSGSSTTDAWLDAVQPSDAVISVGARNRYGHPAPSVVSRLQRRGIRIWRTDRRGTIRLHLTPGRPVWRPARSPAGQ